MIWNDAEIDGQGKTGGAEEELGELPPEGERTEEAEGHGQGGHEEISELELPKDGAGAGQGGEGDLASESDRQLVAISELELCEEAEGGHEERADEGEKGWGGGSVGGRGGLWASRG